MGSKLPHAVKNLNLEVGDIEAQWYAGSSLNHMMATGKSFTVKCCILKAEIIMESIFIVQ